jgi:hypothetical protein
VVGADCRQQRRNKFLGVAERSPQPGGDFVNDPAKARDGGALPIATIPRLANSDDECPHTATMEERCVAGLKVALRPPARGIRQRDRDNVELGHSPCVCGVSLSRLAMTAQPKLAGDKR